MCAAIVVAVLELLEGVNQSHTGSVVLRNFHIFRFCGESRGKVENTDRTDIQKIHFSFKKSKHHQSYVTY